jgi:hypothetical protein
MPRTAGLSTTRRAISLGAVRFLLKALYWLLVLTISLAMVVALILFFESRDEGSIEGAGTPMRAVSA